MTLLRLYRYRRRMGLRPMLALRGALTSRLRDWQHAFASRRLLRHQLPFTDTRV